MIHIAICDDEKDFSGSLTNLFTQDDTEIDHAQKMLDNYRDNVDKQTNSDLQTVIGGRLKYCRLSLFRKGKISVLTDWVGGYPLIE